MNDRDETQCEHREIVDEPTGSFHHDADGVWDDIDVVSYCRDCGKRMEPLEIAWDAETCPF